MTQISHTKSFHQIIENKDIVFSYKGILDNDVITSIITVFNVLSKNNKDVGRKIVKVMVELAQNISYYSEDRCIIEQNLSYGIGLIALLDQGSHYVLVGANKVRGEDGYILSERGALINNMTNDELRWLKRRTRSTVKREKVGASIGLIQTALISENPVEIELVSFNDEFSYYYIKSTFNKK